MTIYVISRNWLVATVIYVWCHCFWMMTWVAKICLLWATHEDFTSDLIFYALKIQGLFSCLYIGETMTWWTYMVLLSDWSVCCLGWSYSQDQLRYQGLLNMFTDIREHLRWSCLLGVAFFFTIGLTLGWFVIMVLCFFFSRFSIGFVTKIILLYDLVGCCFLGKFSNRLLQIFGLYTMYKHVTIWLKCD